MTPDALQALANATMEDKEEMSNLTSIYMKISQHLNQAQEVVLVLPKQLQTLRAHMNSNKPVSVKSSIYNKKYLNN